MKMITAKDGISIAVYKKAAAQPVAVVLLIHGMGDHSQGLPYRLITDHLVSRNFMVLSCDLRGHGRSGGHRMYAKDIDEYVNDAMLVLEENKEDTRSLPLFIAGLSMGALVGLKLLIQYPEKIRGIVIASPALDPSGSPAFIRAMVPLLATLMPKKLVDLKLDQHYISRDKQAAQEYTSDKFFQIRSTPKLGHAVLRAIRQVQASASSISAPVLLLQGSDDKIVPLKGGKEFYTDLASPDKEVSLFEGAFHNLFIETNREEVFTRVSDWLLKRVTAV